MIGLLHMYTSVLVDHQKFYINKLCVDTVCRLVDQSKAIANGTDGVR